VAALALPLPGPELATGFVMAFARVGAIVMLLPGLGERMIPARLRLTLALFLTFGVTPALLPGMAGLAGDPGRLALALTGEAVIGVLIGLSVRMIVSGIETAGHLVAQQAGLAFAVALDPGRGASQPILATLMSLTGIAIVFAADLHLAFVAGLHGSYRAFPPLGGAMTGDAAAHLIALAGEGFRLAMALAAPFLVGGVMFHLVIGILGRAMPQLSLMMLALPAGILAAMALLGASADALVARIGAALARAASLVGGP
jgi:flagellar biosynthetic protein FliR